MVLIRAITMILGFCYLTVPIGTAVAKPCLRFEGVIHDYVTNKPIQGAVLFAKLSTGRTKMGTSLATGSFSGELPIGTIAIQIEKTGYRPQTLSMLSLTLGSNPEQVVLQIPLIAIEKQGSNQTYLQTEQTDYLQKDSTMKAVGKNSGAVQHGHFVITDALRHTSLSAKVCFIYTQTGERKCANTDQNGRLDLDFDQADVIAVEATSTGYQPYEGNLVVESLDGRSVTHNLQLQRELTILSIRADKATRCELQTRDSTYALVAIKGHVGWFSTYEVLPQTYSLVVTYQQITNSEVIELNRGLNYKYWVVHRPKAVTKSTAVTNAITSSISNVPSVAIRPDSLPMVYFEQSSYKLRADSQEVLRQVASYMKSHPNCKLQVAGHTDNMGAEHLNKSLSEFRAAVVASFLARLGIADSQFTKVGYGSQLPFTTNDTEANKALNRRVSLKLTVAQ